MNAAFVSRIIIGLVSDIQLLWLTKHDLPDWVSSMEHLIGIDEVEIVPEIRYLAPPKTTTALLYAAFSKSIDTSFLEFLRSDLHLQVKKGKDVPCTHFQGRRGCPNGTACQQLRRGRG